MNKEYIIDSLNKMIPNPRCELNYNKDYELLLATVLSAQSTDKRVNEVTKVLFEKYDLDLLSKEDTSNIEKIIKSVGSYKKKSEYLQKIAINLRKDYQGVVPNNRTYLESLPGVGRKTTNVVLSNLFNEPTFAIDTHMIRIANNLEMVKTENVLDIEEKMMKYFDKKDWNRINDQMILFGRYICKAKKPLCEKCLFNHKCKKTK